MAHRGRHRALPRRRPQIVRNSEDPIAFRCALTRDYDCLSCVNAAEHDICTLIIESVSHLSRVRCLTGDIEPEAYPFHLKLQIGWIFTTIILPAVACTEEG